MNTAVESQSGRDGATILLLLLQLVGALLPTLLIVLFE